LTNNSRKTQQSSLSPRVGSDSPAIALVLAGGVGSRFARDKPKQLALLAGHPVLFHTLRRFDTTSDVREIVVAVNPDWKDEISEVASDAVRRKPLHLVDGGESRNSSIAAGLAAVSEPEARILVHDGVRPLVSHELIERVASALLGAEMVVPVIDSIDPLLEIEGERAVTFLSRDTHRRGQSPQGFWASTLRDVLREASHGPEKQFATLFELVLHFRPGMDIATVPGDLNNLKITVPVDHMIAGRLLLEE
jgi:2-C-methyl-D-erythritol 4-phosphate cytidylyltransferase